MGRSNAGVRPKGASIPYAVSKAALNHMTRLLAVFTWARHSRKCCGAWLDRYASDCRVDRCPRVVARSRPMPRAASPDDIANAVAMLVDSA